MNIQNQPEKLRELLSMLQTLDDPQMRSMLLIDYADRFREVPEHIATRPFPKEHQVPYCESESYVWLEKRPDGTIQLYFAVENPAGISAKALAAILDQTLSGETARAVQNIDPEMVYVLFGRTITMGKGQGLMALVTMVKSLAQKYV